MIDLYFSTTPNGYKPMILLEELGLDYTIKPVHIGRGEQFDPEFLKIAPNNRIPALVDYAPTGGGEAISIFESGAMMQYLAEKTGKFLPTDLSQRWDTLQWLYWQMGGFGPMLGQNHHFNIYAPEKIDYAIKRYVGETERLYGVLNKAIGDKDFITGEYSIADMACWPWAWRWERQAISLDDFPNVKRWYDIIIERPATQAALAKGDEIGKAHAELKDDDQAKSILFGQNKDTVK